MATIESEDRIQVKILSEDKIRVVQVVGEVGPPGPAGSPGTAGPPGPPGNSGYTHPDYHPATMIVQDATHRFVTDAEKSIYSNKADWPHSHAPSAIVTDSTHRWVTDDQINFWSMISQGMFWQGEVATYADLLLVGNPWGGWVYVVAVDETHEGARSLYIYADVAAAWTYLGPFSFINDATSTVKGVIQLTGDLTGIAAAPELTVTGVTAGEYAIATITVDAKGRITAAEAGELDYNSLSNIPASFNPTEHQHNISHITGGLAPDKWLKINEAGTAIELVDGPEGGGAGWTPIVKTFTIGDGVEYNFACIHNLGTRDVFVAIRSTKAENNYEYPIFQAEATDVNTITIRFSAPPEANEFRVIVSGGFAAEVVPATNETMGIINLTGDLTGTADNPQLTATGVTAGEYAIATITVDAKGRITAIETGAGAAPPPSVAIPMITPVSNSCSAILLLRSARTLKTLTVQSTDNTSLNADLVPGAEVTLRLYKNDDEQYNFSFSTAEATIDMTDVPYAVGDTFWYKVETSATNLKMLNVYPEFE